MVSGDLVRTLVEASEEVSSLDPRPPVGSHVTSFLFHDHSEIFDSDFVIDGLGVVLNVSYGVVTENTGHPRLVSVFCVELRPANVLNSGYEAHFKMENKGAARGRVHGWLDGHQDPKTPEGQALFRDLAHAMGLK